MAHDESVRWAALPLRVRLNDGMHPTPRFVRHHRAKLMTHLAWDVSSRKQAESEMHATTAALALVKNLCQGVCSWEG